ncbi:MAG: DUF488 domain-containing protein [Desulfomonilaceae bacterium]
MMLYTIGHSNRSMEEFLALLKGHDIHALADIRSLPGSNKYPHFNSENLANVLPQNGLQYFWLPKLGGLRRSRKDFPSVNKGLTSRSFRSYADYMATEEFREGVHELVEIASQSATAYMCAEALYWRCHRRLLSDYLVAHGMDVNHILSLKQVSPHKMTQGSLVTPEGLVIYPSLSLPA